MHSKRSWVGVAAAIVILAIPASAGAATQIGETFLPATPSTTTTLLQSGSPAAQYAVPFSGVITSWSFQAGPDPPTLNFKVARSAGGSDYTIVGESGLKTGILSNTLHTFPTRLPVQTGDVIGFFVGDPGEVARVGVSGYTVGDDDDDLDQNVGRSDTYGPVAGKQLDLSAVLEPDCDQDGFGDETQDPELPPTPACDPNPPQTTITGGPKDVVKTKKKRATASFTFAASEPGSFECSLDGVPFSPCTSPYTVKVKRGEHTFQVQAIDQAGNVGAPATDDWKVKKKKKK